MIHVLQPGQLIDKHDSYRPMSRSRAASARCRGFARPCSHSCNVRADMLSFSAASLCDRLCRSRHLYNRSLNLYCLVDCADRARRFLQLIQTLISKSRDHFNHIRDTRRSLRGRNSKAAKRLAGPIEESSLAAIYVIHVYVCASTTRGGRR